MDQRSEQVRAALVTAADVCARNLLAALFGAGVEPAVRDACPEVRS
jgi:hypothetical protein